MVFCRLRYVLYVSQVFPDHILISIKKRHRKFKFTNRISINQQPYTPKRFFTFALVFTDGAVVFHEKCGASPQTRRFPGLLIREAISLSVKSGAKIVLGRHRATSTAFQASFPDIKRERLVYQQKILTHRKSFTNVPFNAKQLIH